MNRWQRRLAQVGLLVGVSLVSTLASLEAYLRWIDPIALRLRGQTIALPTNVTYVFENHKIRGCDEWITQHRNSLGFRGAEPPVQSRGILSVITVGGSTTECFYLSEGHTWPDRLGAELRNAFPTLWINNAGLDGHSTFGHLVLLRQYIVPLHPRWVLFLVGVNDVEREDLTTYDQAMADAPAATRSWTQRMIAHSAALSFLENLPRAGKAWRGQLGHQSLDLARLPRLPDLPSAQQRAIQAHVTERDLPGYRDRVTRLVKECQSHGITPVLITQPALYGDGRDDVTGVDLAAMAVSGNRNGKLAWAILEQYNACTRDVARANHVLLIDLAHALPKSSRYFYDDVHFTNDGAEAVAQIIAPPLAQAMR